MEHIPIISKTVRVPVDIPIHPYLFDHRFEGKAVFPAVESMQVLAKSIKGLAPDMDVACMTHAQFEKFLYIQPGTGRVAAFSDMVIHDNGDITARLLTKQEHGNLDHENEGTPLFILLEQRKPAGCLWIWPLPGGHLY
jgi:hypothetical protein